MAQVIVTLKIMPESLDANLDALRQQATKKIEEFGGAIGKAEIEPVAFGLKAVRLFFVMDEEIGSTEDLEKDIQTIDGVRSVEVTDVRRAIG